MEWGGLPKKTKRTRPISIGGENELTRVATLRDMVGTSTATIRAKRATGGQIPEKRSVWSSISQWPSPKYQGTFITTTCWFPENRAAPSVTQPSCYEENSGTSVCRSFRG